MQGLNEELQDELATRHEPESLESLIILAIGLHNHLMNKHREKSLRKRLSSSFPQSHSSALYQPPPKPTSLSPAWLSGKILHWSIFGHSLKSKICHSSWFQFQHFSP